MFLLVSERMTMISVVILAQLNTFTHRPPLLILSLMSEWFSRVRGIRSPRLCTSRSWSAMKTHNTKIPVHSFCAAVNTRVLQLCGYWVSRPLGMLMHHAPLHNPTLCGWVAKLCNNIIHSWSWNFTKWQWHPVTAPLFLSVLIRATQCFTNVCEGRLQASVYDFIYLWHLSSEV